MINMATVECSISYSRYYLSECKHCVQKRARTVIKKERENIQKNGKKAGRERTKVKTRLDVHLENARFCVHLPPASERIIYICIYYLYVYTHVYMYVYMYIIYMYITRVYIYIFLCVR